MSTRFLSPKAAFQLIELAEKSYRPPEILALKEEIEAKTRVAELKVVSTGRVDETEINEIVRLKLKLDDLYGDWAKGKL